MSEIIKEIDQMIGVTEFVDTNFFNYGFHVQINRVMDQYIVSEEVVVSIDFNVIYINLHDTEVFDLKFNKLYHIFPQRFG